MKRTIIIAILLTIHCATCFKANASTIGTWNVYMAYSDITDIEPAGTMVYVLSSGSLFSYNVNDESISVYNKANILNDTDISYIAWCKSARRLVIIYSNYNIDLLDNNGNVTNISDYYSKSMSYDKTINNVTINGIYAYISTNFGILKVNVRDAEISDTYTLDMKITNCTLSGNKIYANTAQGIYSADTSDNLLDKSNWKRDTSVNSSIFVSENDIERTSAHGYTEYRTYDSTNKCWWSNQADGKLQSYTETDGQQTITRSNINPEGPKHNHFAFSKFYNGKLYTCGSYTWDFFYDATIQVLDKGEWNMYQSEGISDKTGLRFVDMMCIGIDPLDNKHVMGGAKSGVYEFYDGQFVKHHDNESTGGIINSATQSKNKNYELISAMCYDNNGNLWCFNSQAISDKPLLKMDREGNWTSYGDPKLLTDGHGANFVKGMMVDSRGYLWFANNHYTGRTTFMYDINNDNVYTYNNFINQDNSSIETEYVSSIAEDLEGNIWVGTSQGPLMLTPSQISDPSRGYTQIKVPRNDGTNYADYLLAGTGVTCLAIDGANRKWIGTAGNGVYLISSDNMEEVEHFLTTNSNLISNDIESIDIDKTTGEVFIGTEKGLCSYMGNATEANEEMDKDNVYAYPNPVTPEYTGLITVTGLSYNADVKILTANGAIIAEGTSNGGMFTWDGKDKNGKRVASGVYMVATSKNDGSKGTVCKIAIIN